MKVNKKRLFIVVSMLFVAPSLWAENSKEESDRWQLPEVPVYFTKDVSPQGLKKIYRKLSPAFAGKPYIHEYAADSFYRDDGILAHNNESPNAIPFDFSQEFAQTLGTDSNIYHRGATDKNSPVAQWHDFRFWTCLCYDDTLSMSTDERCQAEPWYPSDECRYVVKSINRYRKKITNPDTVVVLSKFKQHSGAALENMLSGNSIFRFEGNPYHKIFPVAEFWARRISDPDKRTFFITVLTDIEDANGDKHDVGIIGSTSFIAVQKAAFELAHKINPAIRWEYPEDDSLQISYEKRGSHLLASLIAAWIPEGAYHKYPKERNEKKRLSTAMRLLRERGSEHYKIVSLDK